MRAMFTAFYFKVLAINPSCLTFLITLTHFMKATRLVALKESGLVNITRNLFSMIDLLCLYLGDCHLS